MEIKIELPTMSDEQLLQTSFEDAQKMTTADKEQWARLHNKGANLYHVNSKGDLLEVSAAGWWY